MCFLNIAVFVQENVGLAWTEPEKADWVCVCIRAGEWSTMIHILRHWERQTYGGELEVALHCPPQD